MRFCVLHEVNNGTFPEEFFRWVGVRAWSRRLTRNCGSTWPCASTITWPTGMSREEAERDARRRFGSPTAMRERVSAEDAALGIESLWHDVRGALRVFLRSPGFSLVVVATLALGIGANTAIFEILNAVRLRTLPITNPGELVELRIADGNPTGLGVSISAFIRLHHPHVAGG